RGILHSQDLRRSRAKVRVGGMSAPETIGHPSHASENPRRSRLLWSHLEKVRSFRMNHTLIEPGQIPTIFEQPVEVPTRTPDLVTLLWGKTKVRERTLVVKIHQKDPQTQLGKCGTQVRRDRRLADPALKVRGGDDRRPAHRQGEKLHRMAVGRVEPELPVQLGDPVELFGVSLGGVL